ALAAVVGARDPARPADPAGVLAGVPPPQRDLPPIGQDQTVEGTGERGLARPVGTDHTDAVLGQVEVDLLQHGATVVGVEDPFQPEHQGSWLPSVTTRPAGGIG